MDKKTELMNIAQYPSEYLNAMGKTLEARLQETEIEDQKQEIIKEKGLKAIRDTGLSLLGGVGDVISTVLDWNEQVNEDLTEAKKMILLEQYLNKADDHENSINMLKDFLTSPQGNTLFNKILRVVDDSPPDLELTKHLSITLRKIVENGRFEELFEQHKYALAQIESLTPQALTIISDYRQWPPIKIDGVLISEGPKITSDWSGAFTRSYCKFKGVSDEAKYKRVLHSVIALQSQGLIEAFRGNKADFCRLTHVGEDLLAYIS